LAVCRRESFLYSSSGSTTGWLTSLSSHDRVEPTWRPARRSVLSSSAGESGLTSGEQVLVHLGVHRQSGELHLARDERAGALGGEQQPDATGLGCTSGRRPLQPELGERVGRDVGLGVGVEVEQRVGRALAFGERGRVVPRTNGSVGELGAGGERRPPEDLVREPQVDAAFYPDALGEERRVPPGGVVPHPARPLAFDAARPRCQLALGERLGAGQRFGGVVETQGRDATGCAGEDDVHPSILPGAADTADRRRDQQRNDDHSPGVTTDCSVAPSGT
jgi:hypothetical protein